MLGKTGQDWTRLGRMTGLQQDDCSGGWHWSRANLSASRALEILDAPRAMLVGIWIVQGCLGHLHSSPSVVSMLEDGRVVLLPRTRILPQIRLAGTWSGPEQQQHHQQRQRRIAIGVGRLTCASGGRAPVPEGYATGCWSYSPLARIAGLQTSGPSVYRPSKPVYDEAVRAGSREPSQ